MVARGACVVALGGMHGCSWGGACVVAARGCAWLLLGGMRGCSEGGAWLLPGGHAWLLRGVCGCCQGACVIAARGHAWLLLGGHAWDMMRYRDTINEWAVHILLECILVINTKNIRRCMCPSV